MSDNMPRRTKIEVLEEILACMQEMQYLSSIPGMVESIQEGLDTPSEDMEDLQAWQDRCDQDD